MTIEESQQPQNSIKATITSTSSPESSKAVNIHQQIKKGSESNSDKYMKEYLPTPVTPALEYSQLHHPPFKKEMKSNNKNTSTATTSKSSYSTFSVIKPTASTSSNSSSPPLRHTNKSAITAPTVTATTTSSTTDNAKPYPCPECHQTFSRPHNLKSHLTTHSSERPFQCDVCNHHFRRHHDLKRHQKLHTGERPYVCKDCYRSFARLDALNRHRRADGGTACSAVHHQQINKQQQQRPALVTSGSTSTSSIKSIVSKGSAKTTANVTTTPASAAGNTSDNTSPSSTNYSRPVIPQLHIPHPASHLHPKDYHPSPVAPPTSQMSSNTATNNCAAPPSTSSILNIPSLASTAAPTANTSASPQNSFHSSSRLQLLPSPNALPNLPITDNLTPIYNNRISHNSNTPMSTRSLPTTPLSPPPPPPTASGSSVHNSHTKQYHYYPPHSKSPLYHPYQHPSSTQQKTAAQSWSPSYFRVQQQQQQQHSNGTNSTSSTSYNHCTPPASNCSPRPLTLPPLSSASSASPPAITCLNSLQHHHSPAPPLQPPSLIDKLQQENEALKRDLDQIRAMAQRDINSMKARMHDLEVENKVLRSLIQNSSPQQQQQEQVVEDAKMDMDGDRPSNSSRYAHSRTASQASSIHPSEASEATVPASTGADPHMKTEFM